LERRKKKKKDRAGRDIPQTSSCISLRHDQENAGLSRISPRAAATAKTGEGEKKKGQNHANLSLVATQRVLRTPISFFAALPEEKKKKGRREGQNRRAASW